jgi:lysophospholipase L1-like esterase
MPNSFCLASLGGAAATSAVVLAAVLLPNAALSDPAPGREARSLAPQYDCAVPGDVTRLMNPLTRVGKLLAGGEPVKIVAIGSSSTAGAGASSNANTYPARLAVELQTLFPGRPITVVNRGVNGDEARGMLARLDKDVVAEQPDLVLWQVGTNSILRDDPIAPAGKAIHDGIRRLKATGADVVLIDPQFAPKVIAKADVDDMVDLLDQAARSQNVDLFRRYTVMRHWRQVAHIPFDVFISPDELHMNDWSYGCVAKLLAGAIAEAATRSTLTARAKTR